MSSSAVSKIPIIGFNIKMLANTPVGLRMVILRKLQERMGELAMSRFIVHGTKNLSLQKRTLDGLELTINALTLFSGLPPLLSVFGNQIRYDDRMNAWFNKYPIYREWKDLQDGKIKITTVNDIDVPIVSEVLNWLGISKPVNNFFSIVQNIGKLADEVYAQFTEAIDALNTAPHVLVDYLNSSHNKIRFPLELTQIDKNVWIIAMPTLFLEFAVLSSGIYLWWAYKRAFDNAVAKELKKKKAILFPRIKDVDLRALPIKLDIGGKTRNIEQFSSYGERQFSVNIEELEKTVTANMFGLKQTLDAPFLAEFFKDKFFELKPEHILGSELVFEEDIDHEFGLWNAGVRIKNVTIIVTHRLILRVYRSRHTSPAWVLLHESEIESSPNTTEYRAASIQFDQDQHEDSFFIQCFQKETKIIALEGVFLEGEWNPPTPEP